ncbi:GNAT family N-acetyltransferase [Salininema proteolyticum]|uniref:GNAT family N-acetyltransferase n=2 Tax=Salininema proteolyticum TaxID=1607685 RepID=A0ABV8U4A7_9ACTN
MKHGMFIKRATSMADIRAAEAAFDQEVIPQAAQRFLDEPGHHILVAFDGERGVGFISGVETTHPDKGTEMFLYELGVVESHQGQGVGRSLIEALSTLARECGCFGMWVLTERTNRAAMAAYQAAGGTDAGDSVMIDWQFR